MGKEENVAEVTEGRGTRGRRATFVVAKEDGAQEAKKGRRGTFVVPKSAPEEKVEPAEEDALEQTDLNQVDMELTELGEAVDPKCAPEATEKSDEAAEKNSEDLKKEDAEATEACPLEEVGMVRVEECGKAARKSVEEEPKARKKVKASALPVPLRQETDSSSSSDESSRPRGFTAFMAKPGKIIFTAGRKDLSDFAPPKKRSKQRPTLPKPPRARSKQKSGSKAPQPLPEEKKQPKSVYDLSMDESKLESKTEGQGTQKGGTFLERMQTVGRGEPSGLASSPHGIMLVLGTGKRTKPRSQAQKSVHYPQLPCTQLIDCEAVDADSPSGDEELVQRLREAAGHTPIKRDSTRVTFAPAMHEPQEACISSVSNETEAEQVSVTPHSWQLYAALVLILLC